MKRTIIIAEAGVNHNGSLELAKELISKAAQAGADYETFQMFKFLINDHSLFKLQKLIKQ